MQGSKKPPFHVPSTWISLPPKAPIGKEQVCNYATTCTLVPIARLILILPLRVEDVCYFGGT